MKLKYIFYVLFFSTLVFGQEMEPAGSISDENYEGRIMITGGLTYSSYLDTDSKADLGYQYGLSVRIVNWKSFSLSSAVFYTNLENTVYNREGKHYDPDGTVYRTYYDLNFSASFIKIPLLLNYDIIHTKKFILSAGAGPGYSIAFSNHTKTKNFMVSDEIIGYLPPEEWPVEMGVTNDFTADNSGFDFSVILNAVFYKYYCIGVSYNVQFNKILNISHLNYFTLNLSVKI
jgi:hypothetical protein